MIIRIIKRLFNRNKTVKIPVYAASYWGSTMEDCLAHNHFSRDLRVKVKEIFAELPENVRHELCFSPDYGKGAWVERAKFWQFLLKPYLTHKEYHIVMSTFIGWYSRCVRNNAGAYIESERIPKANLNEFATSFVIDYTSDHSQNNQVMEVLQV